MFFCSFGAIQHVASLGRPVEALLPPDVDEGAVDLLTKMLDLKTHLRLTSTQALNHGFLDDCPILPATAASSTITVGSPGVDASIGLVDETAVDFRYRCQESTF